MEQDIIDAQKQTIKAKRITIVTTLLLLGLLIFNVVCLRTIVEERDYALNKYYQVNYELENARDSLTRELTNRDMIYNHPFSVVVGISESYKYLNNYDQHKADSVLQPVILSLKRAGLCK